MKQKKIILIIGAAILLLAFRKPKKKVKGKTPEIGPFTKVGMTAKKNSILFSSPYGGYILNNFIGGEWLTFISEDIDDYFVEYVKPGGKIVKGYISKTDVIIK